MCFMGFENGSSCRQISSVLHVPQSTVHDVPRRAVEQAYTAKATQLEQDFERPSLLNEVLPFPVHSEKFVENGDIEIRICNPISSGDLDAPRGRVANQNYQNIMWMNWWHLLRETSIQGDQL